MVICEQPDKVIFFHFIFSLDQLDVTIYSYPQARIKL